METQQIAVREIPVPLWRRLKAQAAIEGLTIQSALTKAIETYLKKSA